MSEMITPRADIARERRRMMQARKALEAALEQQQGSDLAEFFLACGDYLVYSMGRLHAQDQIIHDLLAERIPADETAAHERLVELNRRQDKSRVVLETFREAVEALRTAGSAGQSAFAAAAHAFIDKLNEMMAPRRNPFFEHTDRLFTEEDWVRIADQSDEFRSREAALFDAVKRSAPAGADPEQYVISHRPG